MNVHYAPRFTSFEWIPSAKVIFQSLKRHLIEKPFSAIEPETTGYRNHCTWRRFPFPAWRRLGVRVANLSPRHSVVESESSPVATQAPLPTCEWTRFAFIVCIIFLLLLPQPAIAFFVYGYFKSLTFWTMWPCSSPSERRDISQKRKWESFEISRGDHSRMSPGGLDVWLSGCYYVHSSSAFHRLEIPESSSTVGRTRSSDKWRYFSPLCSFILRFFLSFFLLLRL